MVFGRGTRKMSNIFNRFILRLSLRVKVAHTASIHISCPGQPADIGAGAVTVVEFWATWCPPCKASIPHLTELQHKYPDVVFIGVTNEEERVAAKFVTQMGDKMDYRVATDPTDAVNFAYMQHFGIQGIPHAFVVDKNGDVSWKGHPMEPGFEEAIQAARSKKSKVDLKSLTREQLEGMKVAELREILTQHYIQYGDCVEKIDLVNRILAHQ